MIASNQGTRRSAMIPDLYSKRSYFDLELVAG